MKSNETLSQEYDFLINALGTLPCGVFVLDRDLTTIWINQRLEKTFSGSSWLGRSLDDLLRDSAEGFDSSADDFWREEDARKWVLPHPKLTGEDAYLEITISAVKNSAGNPTGAVGMVEDVSERMRVERRLQEEASRRRVLVEQSPDGIVVLESNGGVYEANQGFADMLGYSLEEVHQLKIWDWDALYSREEINFMLNAANEGGHNIQTLHRRQDGTILNVEISTNGTTFNGLKLIFCVCRDITERYQKDRERDELIEQLQKSAAEIETLPDILALCSFCKSVRSEQGDWEPVEAVLSEQLQLMVSHGICPACVEKHYSNIHL